MKFNYIIKRRVFSEKSILFYLSILASSLPSSSSSSSISASASISVFLAFLLIFSQETIVPVQGQIAMKNSA